MKKTAVDSITGPQAVGILGSIFRVRRDLVALVKEHVIAGTGLTLEQADLLLDLYGAAELGWDDPKAIKGGWVTLAALKKSLVHAPELLTRRLADLEASGLVEAAAMTREETRGLGIDAKSRKVHLRPKGVEKGKLVYDRYCAVSLQLLNRLPPENLQDAMKAKAFNEELMAALRFGA
jgi:hypothetical protein